MCGIAGIFNFNSQSVNISSLQRFTDSLIHRGPDGGGYELFNNEKLGLGHRRLSILDLSDSGKQPMTLLDGRYTIVYNGEIYNFIELKEELEKEGYKFRTETDTEVLVYAYHQWGKSCFDKFNGMWAFALWDNIDKELLLCRDRFGVKPLYYFMDSNSLAFASETIAFKNLDGFNRTISEQLLCLNINETYSLEGANLTPYQNIVALPAGHWMSIRSDGNNKSSQWFEINKHTKKPSENQAERTEEFLKLFLDSCRIRLRADVPIATALSGGLDSSSVFCSIKKLVNDHVSMDRTPSVIQKAFIACFPDTVQDETDFAKEVVEFTNAEAEFMEVDYKNLPGKIEGITKQFDNISSNPLLALTSVYEGINKNNFKISLDGHGVDEMLFGYRDMVADAVEWSKWNDKADKAVEYFDILKNLYPTHLQNDLETKFQKELNWVIQKQKSPISNIKRLIKGQAKFKLPEINPNPFLKNQTVSSWPVSANTKWSDLNYIDSIPYVQFNKTTLPALLRNYDKASMMNSVEIRMPFMDWRLVTYVFSLDNADKLGEGFTKLILRKAMQGILPEKIRNRTLKIGLSAPLKEWFEKYLESFVMDTLNSSSFQQNKLWNGKEVLGFAEKKYRDNNWTLRDCQHVWVLMNAEIISRS